MRRPLSRILAVARSTHLRRPSTEHRGHCPRPAPVPCAAHILPRQQIRRSLKDRAAAQCLIGAAGAHSTRMHFETRKMQRQCRRQLLPTCSIRARDSQSQFGRPRSAPRPMHNSGQSQVAVDWIGRRRHRSHDCYRRQGVDDRSDGVKVLLIPAVAKTRAAIATRSTVQWCRHAKHIEKW